MTASGRDRRAPHLAHLRRALPPVPGHAVEAVARPHAGRGLRRRRAARAGHGRRDLRPTGRVARRRRLPAPGAVRTLRHRVPGHDRRRARLRSMPTPGCGPSGWARTGRADVPARRRGRPRPARLRRQPRPRSGDLTGEDTTTWAGLPGRPALPPGGVHRRRRHRDRPRSPDRRHRRSVRPRRRRRSSTGFAAAPRAPSTPSSSAARCSSRWPR